MSKNFLLTDKFKGYATKGDPTKLSDGFLVAGSQNVISTDSDTLKLREGYTLDGQANNANTPIESSFDWQTNTADERNVRSYDDELEFRWTHPTTGKVTWERLKNSWADVNFQYAVWWDEEENKDYLLFVNGDSNIYMWSGAVALIGATTANTIKLLDDSTTWAEERFNLDTGSVSHNKTVEINGTTYTYTAGLDTHTLTGVTPNPSGEVSGSLATQTIEQANNDPAADSTTFSNDLIAVLNNQVYIGSNINNLVYISKNNAYNDFTFTAVRLPGEGAELTLDGRCKALIPQEEDMYISASNDQWYKTRFVLADNLASENVFIDRLKTTALEAAKSQNVVAKIKNSIAYISEEPTLDVLGRLEDVDTPQTKPLSDIIKTDFDSLDFTHADTIYYRNNLYIALPNENKVYIYNIEKGYWETPQVLPIRKFSIINGDLYGHSSEVAETYKLFDGTSDTISSVSLSDDDLKAYWKLDEGTGTSASDSSLYGNTATLFNNTAWDVGKVGNCLSFDGLNDYAKVDDNTSLQDIYDSGGSVSTWIYVKGGGGGNAARIVVKSNWLLFINVSGSNARIQFFKVFSGDNGVWQTDYIIPLNTWTHVAVTYNASSVANDPIIYINGVSVSFTEATTPTGATTTDVGEDLYIGNNSALNRTWDGLIDEVRLYTRVLSADDVSLLYNSPDGSVISQKGAINGIAKFSYLNYGDRVALKNFNEFYTEGYITAGTELTLNIDYEYEGSLTSQSFAIDGDDSTIIFTKSNDSSLGKDSLGKNPLGSVSSATPSDLKKFRQINTTVKQAFHEVQFGFESNDIDASWELLAFGAAAIKAPESNISIKK